MPSRKPMRVSDRLWKAIDAGAIAWIVAVAVGLVAAKCAPFFEDPRWPNRIGGVDGVSIAYGEAVSHRLAEQILPIAQRRGLATGDRGASCDFSEMDVMDARTGACRIAGYSADYYTCEMEEYSGHMCASIYINNELFWILQQDFMKILLSDCASFLDHIYFDKNGDDYTRIAAACASNPEKQVIYVDIAGAQTRISAGEIWSRKHKKDPWAKHASPGAWLRFAAPDD